MTYQEVLTQNGYTKDPVPTVDTHETWTNKSDKNQVLIDVAGKEWHHMINGDIDAVGDLDQNGLEDLSQQLEQHAHHLAMESAIMGVFVQAKQRQL